MFVQDNLQKIKINVDINFPSTKLLLMFIGVVIGPSVLFAVDGQSSVTLWQSASLGTLMTAGLLLLVSIGVGLMMFRRESYEIKPFSISQNFK